MKWATTCALTGLLLYAGAARAQDEALIGRLGSADDYQAQLAAVDDIKRRLQSGPLGARDTEALLGLLVYRQQLADRFLATLLPRLAGGEGLREQELNLIAAGLASDVVYQYGSAAEIGEALNAAAARLPDEAFASLIAAVQHVAVLNARAAMEVLAQTPPDDARYSVVLEAMRRALEQSASAYGRSQTATLLGRLGAQAPLPATVVDTLTLAATDDADGTVRLDALEVLTRQPIDAQTRSLLSRAIAESIIDPGANPPSSVLRGDDATARTAELLAALHELPYPEHVVDALIRSLWRSVVPETLALLAAVVERDELTTAQRDDFERAARMARRFEQRAAIYATLYPSLSDAQLASASMVFTTAGDSEDRVKAGYQLLEHYRRSGVPDDVAESVAEVLSADVDSESRHIAARLLLATGDDSREREVIEALRRHADDYEFNMPVIEQIAAADPAQLVVEFASDETLPAQFRSFVLHPLLLAADPDAGLAPALTRQLARVARGADDYALIQKAGDTLDAWGEDPPVRVALTNRANQSLALFVVWCVLAGSAVIAGLVGLVRLSTMPLRSARKAWRLGLVGGWTLITGSVLVLLAGGLLGFLGHNSVPLPIDTLKFNLPGFVGAVALIVTAWLVLRRATIEANAML